MRTLLSRRGKQHLQITALAADVPGAKKRKVNLVGKKRFFIQHLEGLFHRLFQPPLRGALLAYLFVGESISVPPSSVCFSRQSGCQSKLVRDHTGFCSSHGDIYP